MNEVREDKNARLGRVAEVGHSVGGELADESRGIRELQTTGGFNLHGDGIQADDFVLVASFGDSVRDSAVIEPECLAPVREREVDGQSGGLYRSNMDRLCISTRRCSTATKRIWARLTSCP